MKNSKKSALASLIAHPCYDARDLSYLKNKGYTYKEILVFWDRMLTDGY